MKFFVASLLSAIAVAESATDYSYSYSYSDYSKDYSAPSAYSYAYSYNDYSYAAEPKTYNSDYAYAKNYAYAQNYAYSQDYAYSTDYAYSKDYAYSDYTATLGQISTATIRQFSVKFFSHNFSYDYLSIFLLRSLFHSGLL